MNILKCYQVLDVKPGATKEEIKEAYRDLIQFWHPDRCPDIDRLREKANQKTKELNLAYKILMDIDCSYVNLEQEVHPKPKRNDPPTQHTYHFNGSNARLFWKGSVFLSVCVVCLVVLVIAITQMNDNKSENVATIPENFEWMEVNETFIQDEFKDFSGGEIETYHVSTTVEQEMLVRSSIAIHTFPANRTMSRFQNTSSYLTSYYFRPYNFPRISEELVELKNEDDWGG